MRQPVLNVLRASSVSAGCLFCIGVAEGLVRERATFDMTSPLSAVTAALGAFLFLAVLLIQLVRPRSLPLAYGVAGAAAVNYVVLPAGLLLPRTSPDFPPVDVFAVTAMLSFTYSVRGWAAVAAASAFVLLLSRAGTVGRPVRSASARRRSPGAPDR